MPVTTHFFGFSPESFEQFAKVLSTCVFGPGVSSFGNGPDGGREAVFRGEVPYPYPPATQWSGYGVVQAKCKEKTESTQKDQGWALKQLADELERFTVSKKRRPKPEYYIFITNVDLTSTAGGGKDRAEALLQEYYRKLPLKGHAIWDSSQLAIFLDTYEMLRKSFVAYLTTGDVLATLLQELESRRPNAIRILTGFLQSQLRADESARLDQGGNRTDQQLRLARLFFDIPASPEPQLTPPDEATDSDGRMPKGVLSELLVVGSRRLDPSALYEQEVSSEIDGGCFATRYVLLGGPGSGKSTVGQFLAQIHRAALLERRPPHEMLYETRQVIRETKSLCMEEALPWPATPRYPVRVELNRLAKWLAIGDFGKRGQSLSGYLLHELAADDALTNDDLLELLGKHPWLLILDGLDEVPATSNRAVLVGAVNDFLAAARQIGSDLFVVATSRQQGYAGEFATGGVAFRHMHPLSTTRAVRYVQRYAEARFGASDPNRARDVVNHIKTSARNALTAQLMSSPLQVTFMATVIAARGDPGQNRWQLFDNYYRTIYERELQKAVPPYDVILSRYQTVIDRLHHDIGFWLQFIGESSRGMVTLPLARFEALVREYLRELGHEEAAAAQLIQLITDAARDRLIFLTSRTEGELSFDVRSLQEYMASECLMTGDAEVIKARLQEIAPPAYWRNVFLFSANKCFADARSRHLQDFVRLLCVDLANQNDRALSISQTGSELALDLLQGGALAENLTYSRHLAEIALLLAERSYFRDESREGASFDRRLALAYREPLRHVYEAKLGLQIGQTDFNRTLGAWPILLRMMSSGVGWTGSLVDQLWPKEPAREWSILEPVVKELEDFPWIKEKVDRLIPGLSPNKLFGLLYSRRAFQELQRPIDGLSYLIAHYGRGQQFLVYLNDGVVAQSHFTPIGSQDEVQRRAFDAIEKMPKGDSAWLPLILANELFRAPNRKVLSNILEELARAGWPNLTMKYTHPLPWPMAACLEAARTPDGLAELAAVVLTGKLGDTDDWLQAESRFIAQGCKLDDLTYRPLNGLPFDKRISACGWPGYYVDISPLSDVHSPSYNEVFFSTLETLPADRLAPHILFSLGRLFKLSAASSENIDPRRIRALLEKNSRNHGERVRWGIDLVPYSEELPQEIITLWIDFFDWLGRSEALFPGYPIYSRIRAGKDWTNIWELSFAEDPTRVGLLRLLSRHASNGSSTELIPEALLRITSFESTRDRFAALLLIVTRSRQSLYDEKTLAMYAENLISSACEPNCEERLFRAIEQHLDRVESMGGFLIELYERTPRSNEIRKAKLQGLIRKMLRRRSSGLQRSGRLTALGLPQISPLA